MIDRVEGNCYKRVISSGEKAIGITASQAGTFRQPKLNVSVEGARLNSSDQELARKSLEKLLGYRIDLRPLYRTARNQNTPLNALLNRFVGVKPTRFPSLFETLLNAISCQQVSLVVGLLLMGRLAMSFGAKISDSYEGHAFPLPEQLSALDPAALRDLGYSTQKSHYIIGLSKSVAEGRLNLESVSNMKDQDALEYLQEIPGIGRWSAQYLLLRGLGRLHRFPADDIGAQNGLKKLYGLRKRPDYERTIKLIEPWQPYAGLIYFHLLLNRLEMEGFLTAKA